MKGEDIAVLAVQAVLIYGVEAETILGERTVRLRLARQFDDADLSQAIAEAAGELLRTNGTSH